MEENTAAGWIAANKFGLGMKPGEAALIVSDPRGWLRAQLDHVADLPAELDTGERSAELLLQAREQQRSLREMQNAGPVDRPQAALRELRRAQAETRQSQQGRRLQAAINTAHPFAERLVRFWSNHFTVAIGGGAKQVLGQIALPYENEAIRSRLDGSFADLLLAVEQHPAMLIYLDNAGSTGPGSVVGQRRDRGLNENLAREILELHTLGVDGGYSQADVTALANIITGWTVDQGRAGGSGPLRQRNAGGFVFVAGMHEPGSQQLLGSSYRDRGLRQGELALRDLASHPSTARHVARKLATHFIADNPPPAAVAQLERVYLDTDGSLPAVHEALLELDAAWDPAFRKLKTPEELIVSVARACEINAEGQPREIFRLLLQGLQTFGQVPFTASSPAGWADDAGSWGSPDALLKRIDWVQALVQAMPQDIDPLQLAEQILPLQPTLQQALERAESVSQAMVLLFAGPQFQWRGA